MIKELEQLVDYFSTDKLINDAIKGSIIGMGKPCLEPFSWATVPLKCWYENEPEQDCPHYFYRWVN